MDATTQFLRENASWLVPIVLVLLGGVGWLVRKLFESKPRPQQVQHVSGKSVGVQAGRDASVQLPKDQ